MKIWQKDEKIVGEKYLIIRRDGSVPVWPHFVLGARDLHAERALRHYAYSVLETGGDKEYAASLHALADDFRAYRTAHGHGDPFAPPHRKDDPRVLLAMRGTPVMIQVSHDTDNAKKEPL